MSHIDMENFQSIEDEPFPSFLSNASLRSSVGNTLSNMTLASTLGMPMAASTVAKIRPSDNRVTEFQASCLEDGQFSLRQSYEPGEGREKFVLSLREDLENVDDFIAANRFSGLLMNVNLNESESASFSKTSSGVMAPPLMSGSLPIQATDLSTGRLSFPHIGENDKTASQATLLPIMLEEEDSTSEKCSIASFLANEKLMSLDSMNSDLTDDDIDVNQLHDEELELYFHRLNPPEIQRGQVEGQEIPLELPSSLSQNSCTETERKRHFDQRNFHKPDVRLAATGIDSCPASDEEELEASQKHDMPRFLLPRAVRQPVGESHLPHIRPMLEGGSSDDELITGMRNTDTEHHPSAKGQVINLPITGNGGDETSGSEEGNGRLSRIPLPSTTVQGTCNVIRSLDIVGRSGENEDQHEQMGHRAGLVGTGEAVDVTAASGNASQYGGNWNMILNRQEALNAIDSSADVHLDSIYLRVGAGHSLQEASASVSHVPQGIQSTFNLSKVIQDSNNTTELGTDQDQTVDLEALGLRGGPCEDSSVLNKQDSTNCKEDQPGDSLDYKYLFQSFNENHQEHNDIWSHQEDNVDLSFHQGTNETHSVVYQNEEGKWVTDLAYYSSFEKEMEANLPEEIAAQFQSEDFLGGSEAMCKIIEDQKEFEKEHRFMQEENIQAANMNEVLGDTSWKIPTSSNILMRASQVSSDLEAGNQSYLRISLGEFFQRRSEALGCLGSGEDGNIKRPSFGYFITSPEKREPVALLRPSDLFSRDSIHNDTVHGADDTLNTDDLDKTLEPKTAETPHENMQKTTTIWQDSKISVPHEDTGCFVRSSESPNYKSNLILSISTIASAIADASISSDPAQLAAMIMELSKHTLSKSPQQAENLIPSPVAALKQNILLKDLPNTTSGDLTTPDMEKYLKRAEISSSDSDGSTSQSCIDILTMADRVVGSNQQTQQQLVPLDSEATLKKKETVNKQFHIQKGKTPRQSEEAFMLPNSKSDVKGSAIPRRKSSSLPIAATHPLESSSASGLSSSSLIKSKPDDLKSTRNDFCASPSTHKSVSESDFKIGKAQPQVASTSSTGNSTFLNCDGGMSTSAPNTSPGFQSGSCSEISLKVTPQKPRIAGSRTRIPISNQAQSSRSSKAAQSVLKEKIATVDQDLPSATHQNFVKGSPESHAVEVTHCSFRPSTSPLTHSSPSQASIPSEYGEEPCSPSSGRAQRSPAEDPCSPQSFYSSPSLSRLTYLSIDNTSMPTTEYLKKNTSMSLSTTIIRASPTPPAEPFDNGNATNFSKSPEPLCNSEIPGLNQKTSELASRDQSKSDLQKDYENGYAKSNRQSEPRLCAPGNSGYSNKLDIQHQPGTVTGQANQLLEHVLVSGPSFTDNFTYGSIPIYSSQGAMTNLNLLTGHSLFSSHLAQQCLSSERLLHAPGHQLGGPYSLYGVSAPLPPPNASMAHMPTSIQSGCQEHLSHTVSKTFEKANVASLAAQDLLNLTSHVLVPSEVSFPSSCCVGIASQTSLNIFNPSERWQQCSISITSLSIDGEKVESPLFNWLIVKNKTIIGPKCSEEQKVLFIAPKAGLYRYTLTVLSWPASAESERVVRSEVSAKNVVLIAVAENPAIKVDVGNSGCLDFGDLAEGSTKALPLKLVNRTHATVPIRLVIKANASAWHCFGFSKNPDSMISASSVISHVLHASHSEHQESLVVWVYFSAPQKYISKSYELGPADEYSAQVDIEVDSPGPSHVIQSIALKARSGTARVHAPKDLQMVRLQATLGKTVKQIIPLKNAGNIEVLLRLKCIGDSCFTVRPEELSLKAGEEQGIVVSFTAQGSQKHRESILMILVLPSGPEYEVILQGEMVPDIFGKVPSTHLASSQAEAPPILSNKQFMAWGGVTLGTAVQQKLVLRNNSSTTSQQLRLLIRGQDQDCFQLQSLFGPDERLTHNRELSIKPKEDVTVRVLFAPTRIAYMLAKLEIKQSAAHASHPAVKFTIPLSGYGGTSNVILEELRKHSDGYVATLSGVQAGCVSKLCVSVRNTGSRAAFVKAVAYSSLQNRAVMDSAIISLSPSQFVLKERSQEVITISMKASCREQALCQSGAALLATVCLFCGDEVSRQQFRKLLLIKPDTENRVLSENSLLKGIPFNEIFLGEEEVTEACDLPPRANEAKIFYGNMKKVMLSLFGTMEMSDSAESDHTESIRPLQLHASETDRMLGTSSHSVSNVSLDVLPVKGPPLSPLEPVLKHTELSLDNTWSIKPEQLVFTAPTLNGAAETKHVHIQNHSNRGLSFELSWPAHCLTITPQHGVVEPQSHLQILISPSLSLATLSDMLPWSGQIYVHCDDQQKSIKVQIREDMAKDVSATSCATDRSLGPLPPQAEIPNVQVPISSNKPQVEIKNRTLVFPPTGFGESSECSLEVVNHGEEVRWYLSSFAPPYVKVCDGRTCGFDNSDDVYRATYTAFRCEKVSGTLGLQERMKVQIAFLPRDCGDYAQFWDLECHPAGKPQHKCSIRFQLCGTGKKTSEGSGVTGSCSWGKAEGTVKNRKKLEVAGSKTGSSAETQKKGVYAPQSLYTFPATSVGSTSTLKINLRNNSSNTHELKFKSPKEPFYIKHASYSLRSQHYINLPVQFVPAAVGQFSSMLLVQVDTGAKIFIELSGEALQ